MLLLLMIILHVVMLNMLVKFIVFRFKCWINSRKYGIFRAKKNYSCDVIYVTNNELGFDYLRDNMAFTLDEIVQRPFFYCVVDEVDSILIDEARTPLIISGPSKAPTQKYLTYNEIS